MLSDMLQNPQLLSHSHTYVLNLKSNSAPPILPIRHHRVSNVITTATNPRQIGLTNRDLGLTEMGLYSLCVCPLPKSVSPSLSNRYYRDYNVNFLVDSLPKSVPPSLCNRSHQVYLTNSLVRLLPKSVPSSLCNRSQRDYVMP